MEQIYNRTLLIFELQLYDFLEIVKTLKYTYMEWHTEEPQLYSSGLNSGTVCFKYQWILIRFTFFYERMYQNRNHNYHINYFVKNHKLQYKIFHLILQSMIHFVSLFIPKTYHNMIVNFLIAFFRQIFKMTDTCIYREIFLFSTDIEMACTDIYREIH